MIAQNAVYAAVADASSGGIVYVLDAATGATIWSVPIASTYDVAEFAFDSGLLFVVNFSGVATALNAANGDTLWQTSLAGQYQFVSPPAARGGVLYVTGAGSGTTVYAVRESDGATLWSQSVSGGALSSPTLSEEGVFVSFPCHQFRRSLCAERRDRRGSAIGDARAERGGAVQPADGSGGRQSTDRRAL